MLRDSLSNAEARRIALAAQGLDRPRPDGRIDLRHLRVVIGRLGLLQLDFVNVVVPAHYQVLYSRLGPYEVSLLDRLAYRRRELTEQWAHEASLVPVELWPHLDHRRAAHPIRPRGFDLFLEEHSGYVDWVLKEIGRRGPLAAEDLPAPDGVSRRLKGSWLGTVPRALLEHLFGRGVLAVAERRPSMARAFDRSERLVPPEHHSRTVTRDDAQRELIRIAARAHGVATVADLADYFRLRVGEAQPRIAELVEGGELREVTVEGWRGSAYLHRDARLPRHVGAATLLSPFDPLIWTRRRTERLFGFDYRFEIFTPREQRRWGCYVLPFLLGDRLVARVDLKADRASGRLVVLSTHYEPGADRTEIEPALNAELETMAGWLGLEPPVAPRGV
ncbi:MAG: crosslink repair DNA glycosylase YcaQ family protein [Gaiellaceae bacterium]